MGSAVGMCPPCQRSITGPVVPHTKIVMKPVIEKEIARQIDVIEREEAVRVLYACESGSRAWGFESVDSDYDVRFLYVHPRDWYLSVEERRDVIERPIDGVLDLCGWDLLKALRLFRKSNPQLLEWLVSPIIYRESGSAAPKLRDLAAQYISPRAVAYHYLHMAQGNFREYLRGEDVWTKKYLYVLRPLLAIQWIEQERGIVPMEFHILLPQKNAENTKYDLENGYDLRFPLSAILAANHQLLF